MLKIYDPVLVVGAGRCGTSLVAGILYYLNIFMGNEFVSANKTNPYGHWEDKEFHDLNTGLMTNQVNQLQWQVEIEKLIVNRRALLRPWGFKDPRMADLIRFYLPYFKQPRFIWCRRNAEEIENSMVKAYPTWTLEQAKKIREHRENQLKRYLKEYEALNVNYHQLLSNKESEVERIFQFIYSPDKQAALSIIHLKGGLRNEGTSTN